METVLYSLADLIKLKAEYLKTADDSEYQELWCTYQEIAGWELRDFFGWLNIRNNTP